jgi:glycosyl transferase family 25
MLQRTGGPPVTGLDDIGVYVVNLRRRPDRRELIQRQLERLPATYTSDWDGPFDGRATSRESLERAGYWLFDWQITSTNPWWSRPLKYGEIGCALSHLACWTDAASRPEPFTLIVEDDAVLCPDFTDRLLDRLDGARSRYGFGLLYLGRYPLEPDQPAGPGLVVPGYSHCTYGYLMARHALRALLGARLDQAIIPVDEFLPALYTDHPRPDVRKRFPRRLAALACDPPLVRQMPKDKAGSDTEDSRFVEACPIRVTGQVAVSPDRPARFL